MKNNKIQFLNRENYFLIGVFPLFALTILFIFLGSYGIERTASELDIKTQEYNTAVRDRSNSLKIEQIDRSLQTTKYERSMSIYMLVCAGIMVIHALVLFELKDRWVSAYGTISISLIVFGVLRRSNNIGNSGTNTLYVAFGSVMALILFVIAARGGNFHSSDEDEYNFHSSDEDEYNFHSSDEEE